MSNDGKAREIREEMAALRRDLDIVVEEASATARQWSDWRHYIRRFPWASMAAMVAVGYMVVPNRKQIISPSAEELAELAKRSNLYIGQEPKQQSVESLTSKLVNLLAMATTRAALAYVGGKMAAVTAAQHQTDGDGASRTRSPK
jgi:hypothetical protein